MEILSCYFNSFTTLITVTFTFLTLNEVRWSPLLTGKREMWKQHLIQLIYFPALIHCDDFEHLVVTEHELLKVTETQFLLFLLIEENK